MRKKHPMTKARAFATLAALEESLDYDREEDENILTRALFRACEDVEDFCNRTLSYVEDNTFRFSGFRGTVLTLPDVPVRAVDSITYKGEEITDFDVIDLQSGQLYRESGWFEPGDLITDSLIGDAREGLVPAWWKVTYSSGYYGPSQDTDSTPRDLPFILEDAALGLACSFVIQTGDDVSVAREHLLKSAWWRDHSNHDKWKQTHLKKYKRIIQA